MHNKPALILISLLFWGVAMSSTQARDCPVVAKIYQTNVINEVSIWRKGTENLSGQVRIIENYALVMS